MKISFNPELACWPANPHSNQRLTKPGHRRSRDAGVDFDQEWFFTALTESCLNILGPAFARLLEQWREQLCSLSQHSQYTSQQNRYYLHALDVALKAPYCQQQFDRALRQQFVRCSQCDNPPKVCSLQAAAYDKPTAVQQSYLPGPADITNRHNLRDCYRNQPLSLRLELQESAQRHLQHNALALARLSRRLFLIHYQHTAHQDLPLAQLPNPFTSEGICDAFATATACLDLDPALGMLLLHQFEYRVLERMQAVYREAHRIMDQVPQKRLYRPTSN